MKPLGHLRSALAVKPRVPSSCSLEHTRSGTALSSVEASMHSQGLRLAVMPFSTMTRGRLFNQSVHRLSLHMVLHMYMKTTSLKRQCREQRMSITLWTTMPLNSTISAASGGPVSSLALPNISKSPIGPSHPDLHPSYLDCTL